MAQRSNGRIGLGPPLLIFRGGGTALGRPVFRVGRIPFRPGTGFVSPLLGRPVNFKLTKVESLQSEKKVQRRASSNSQTSMKVDVQRIGLILAGLGILKIILTGKLI